MTKPTEKFFSWLVYPLVIVIALQLAIWAVVSFVLWDVFWMTPFAHRLMFVALCLWVWGSMIDDAKKDKKKGENNGHRK